MRLGRSGICGNRKNPVHSLENCSNSLQYTSINPVESRELRRGFFFYRVAGKLSSWLQVCNWSAGCFLPFFL